MEKKNGQKTFSKANKKNKKIYDPKFPGIEKELYIVCVHTPY
jgi:hypothetical protein